MRDNLVCLVSSQLEEPIAPWQEASRQPLVRDLISAALSWATCHIPEKSGMDASERNLLDAVQALNKSV